MLNALAVDNLKDRSDVTIMATNHPRKGGVPSFNEALAGMYAAGVESDLTPPSPLPYPLQGDEASREGAVEGG